MTVCGESAKNRETAENMQKEDSRNAQGGSNVERTVSSKENTVSSKN